MKKYVYIGIAGSLGAILRYTIKNISIYNYKGSIPLNTLIINITGSFILAFILSITYEQWKYSQNMKLGITTGFLGAFTTFSTMCKESVMLMMQGHYLSAISYIVISVIVGIGFAQLGALLCRKVVYKVDVEEDYYLDDEEKA
jgi:CrcB protein